MSDGDHMKQSVGRAAHCDIKCYRVVDGVGGDDVAEADAASQQLQHLTRGGARQLVSLG